jgi:hypothetical protein
MMKMRSFAERRRCPVDQQNETFNSFLESLFHPTEGYVHQPNARGFVEFVGEGLNAMKVEDCCEGAWHE